ncbi:hypothetical protein EYF80_034691 [Liparis tanakae]|uniref:Uncharacterized protein n=1 Tax=Liparis tanakae TaxID=230148 RepID=A0A4Z2GNG9_9TELE|nr:hypothetical protein EYF80_034691 [Liparis tanakae]
MVPHPGGGGGGGSRAEEASSLKASPSPRSLLDVLLAVATVQSSGSSPRTSDGVMERTSERAEQVAPGRRRNERVGKKSLITGSEDLE